jgi:hypothetical protein
MLLHGLNARCWSSGFIRTTPRRAPQPSDDVTVHVVLNDYGKLGYEETDRVKARGRRAGNSAPGRSFTVVRFIFTALPFLTRPKDTPANILSRSAMVLSGRAAQDMEAGSSSFPGVGASGRTPIRRLRPAESSRADHPPPCPACHLSVCRAAPGTYFQDRLDLTIKHTGIHNMAESGREKARLKGAHSHRPRRLKPPTFAPATRSEMPSMPSCGSWTIPLISAGADRSANAGGGLLWHLVNGLSRLSRLKFEVELSNRRAPNTDWTVKSAGNFHSNNFSIIGAIHVV